MVTTSKNTQISSHTAKALRPNEQFSHSLIKNSVAPHSHWSDMSASEHFVQFYESEIFLLDSLNEFIGAGLSAGDACIVIATKARRETLEEILWVESKKGEGATFHFTLPLFQEGRAKLPPGFVDTRAIDNAQ